jgi:hypothetical protein
MHHPRTRAHLRDASARKRASRDRYLAHLRHWDHALDLDYLRMMSERPVHYGRFAGLSVEQRDHLRSLLDSEPRLAYGRLRIDAELIELIGIGIMRILAPWSLGQYLGLDQRLTYERLAHEPEWNKPDIVRKARPIRKRVWRRDEDLHDLDDDDFYAGARRIGTRTQLYNRFGGGEVKT